MLKTRRTILASAFACMATAAVLVTGCEPNETVLLTAANTAGNLGLSAWFAIDDPDCEVKEALKYVVTAVQEGASRVGEGGTYVDALTPAIQDIVAQNAKLTGAQKNLINTGAAVILGTLDTFMYSNAAVKSNAELASKVVASFCRGCLTAIERSDNCTDMALKKAHQVIQMRYDAQVKAFVVK
jgi:hypothetical protein